MRAVFFLFALSLSYFYSRSTATAATIEGFYKNVFVDGGVGLVKLTNLYAANELHYSYEFIAVDSLGADTQNLVMVKSSQDDNGALLYPDGEPRFALLYTCGGYGDHLASLGKDGKQRIRDHYFHGGSYVGTCAGNYLSCKWAYGLYPGSVKSAAIKDRVGGIIPKDSPLLKYFDFGGDFFIDSIMHADGGYGKVPLPPKAELMLIHRHASEMDSQPSCWAYKENDTSGRVVGLTSHPEFERRGEKLNYFMACLQYALAGLAPPSLKGALEKGHKRTMDKTTGDNAPAFTRIGDLQYHHFSVSLPQKTDNFQIKLDGEEGFDLHLFVAKDTVALKNRARYADTTAGPDKNLLIPTVDAGTWYIGVKCATTVTAQKKTWGYEYSGQLAVLNGVAYTIEAHWGESAIHHTLDRLTAKSLRIQQVADRVVFSTPLPGPFTITVYDARGKVHLNHISGSNSPRLVIWQSFPAGLYVVSLFAKGKRLTRRFSVVR